MKTRFHVFLLIAIVAVAWAQVPTSTISTANDRSVMVMKHSGVPMFSSNVTYSSDMDTYTFSTNAKVKIEGKVIIDRSDIDAIIKALNEGAMYANSYANERELIASAMGTWSPQAHALTATAITTARAEADRIRALAVKIKKMEAAP